MKNDYYEYLNGYSEGDKNIQIEIYEKTEISKENLENIKSLNKEIRLLLFAEVYCPDCRVFVPIVEKMREINPNLKIEIIKRKGNEELMGKYKVTRIPSLIKIEDGKSEVVYEEFPENVKIKIKSCDVEEKYQLIKRYRTGEFNQDIEKELIDKIYT